MSAVAPSNVRRDARRGAAANGFVSAVFLVVLLATSGWPADAHGLVEQGQVSSCEVHAAAVVRRDRFAREQRELLHRPAVVAGVAARAHEAPRPLPRTRRVDRRGLQPARAPTN